MVFCATEIKKKGIIWVGKIVDQFGEIIVSVRGKNRYVVLSIEEYERLKEIELNMTLKRTQNETI